MKKILFSSLIAVICTANIAFLYYLHVELNEIREELNSLEQSVYEMTKAPKIGEIPVDDLNDIVNPRPNNLQDVLNRIDRAEKNIRVEIYHRTQK